MSGRYLSKQGNGGFTLIELIMVLVIVGVIALIAIPRFLNQSIFESKGFADHVHASLRYAQKLAVAQRRDVHVRLNGSSIALCLDSGCSAANIVLAPAGENSGKPATLAACSNNTSWFCEAPPPGVTYTSTFPQFFFNGLGKPYLPGDTATNSSFTTLTLAISGDGLLHTVIVERDTGYVH